jgi:repressor LexA
MSKNKTQNPMTELTEQEAKILSFIKNFTSKNGYPPSIREIAKFLKSKYTRTAEHYLKKLEEKNLIKREKGISRGIKLINQGVEVPLLGNITAGKPILAVENIETYLTIDQSLLKPGICFLLRVRGDSMKNAAILDGDLVLVRRQQTAQNGDIIAALIENETTIKKLKIKGDKIILQPENPEYEPITIKNPENFSIIGKVIAVIRKL